jgi:hypothetical protein
MSACPACRCSSLRAFGEPGKRLGKGPAEDGAEVLGADARDVLDQAEQVGPRRRHRSTRVVLREPVELPQQRFATVTKVAVQNLLGRLGLVCRPVLSIVHIGKSVRSTRGTSDNIRVVTTVASWNVLHRIHAENWGTDAVKRWPDESERIAAVTAFLAERTEQVIALQEVSGDQLADIPSASSRIRRFFDRAPTREEPVRPRGRA